MALDPKLLEILACPEDKGPLLYFEDESSLYNPRLQAPLRRARRHPDHADRRGRDRRRRRSGASHRQGRGRRHPADVRGVARAWPPTRSTSARRSARCRSSSPPRTRLAGKVPAAALPDADDFDHIVTLGHGRLRDRRQRPAGGRHRDAAGAGHGAQALPHAGVRRRRARSRSRSSYSGDTEETLEMAQRCARRRRHASSRSRAAASWRSWPRSPGRCTSAAPMASRCRGSRSGALVAPLFVVLFRMGMLPEAHAGLLRAQQQLARRRDQCRPDGRRGAATRHASWRASSGAPSRSSTAAAASVASPRCAGSSR